jgi:putrescine importer
VTSLTLGLVWAGVGLVYLAYLTGRFRKPPPQFDAAKSERAWGVMERNRSTCLVELG